MMQTSDARKRHEEKKAKAEVLLRRDIDPLFDACPDCGDRAESRWQHVDYDDANPVRWCHKCDKAWIWRE